jgi:hypothetical protein
MRSPLLFTALVTRIKPSALRAGNVSPCQHDLEAVRLSWPEDSERPLDRVSVLVGPKRRDLIAAYRVVEPVQRYVGVWRQATDRQGQTHSSSAAVVEDVAGQWRFSAEPLSASEAALHLSVI